MLLREFPSSSSQILRTDELPRRRGRMKQAHSCVVGYDPGGNDKHGLAVLHLDGSRPLCLEATTLSTAEDCLQHISRQANIKALGVDTLTCWSTGKSGWHPADRWLRATYPMVRGSVVTPNGLYGSMGLNGQAVIIEARAAFSGVAVTETHPKVLHWHMTGRRYDFENERTRMEDLLASALGVSVVTETDDAWDAAVSALAAHMGTAGLWTRDLHAIPTDAGERLVRPAGSTSYYWPD